MEPRALHRVGKLRHWATPKSDFFKINVYIFFFFFMENEAKEIVLYNFYSSFCCLDFFVCLARW